MATSFLFLSPNSPKPQPLTLHHLLLRPKPRHLPFASNRNNNKMVQPPDRLASAAFYLYPFLNGVHHGRFLLAQLPPASDLLLRSLAPASRIYHANPINPLLLLLAIYFAVVCNPDAFPRFVRFNAMQAITLDALLIFPDLLCFFLGDGAVGFEPFRSFENTVFLYLLVSLLYGAGACLLGKTPRLPLLADSAESLVP